MKSTTPNSSSSATPNPTFSPADQGTQKVAEHFAKMFKDGNGTGTDTMQNLYADDARHVESMEMPGSPRITEGKPALLKKSKEYYENHTIHSSSCTDPIVNGDQFTCEMSMDCTSKEGPIAGKRMNMTETCLYTVKNGTITEGKFFYGANPKQ
jgi:ketosteroid isomerase-like protein